MSRIVNFTITEELDTRLKAYQAPIGVSTAEVIRRALNHYLLEREQEQAGAPSNDHPFDVEGTWHQ